jgi:hypothetical protein
MAQSNPTHFRIMIMWTWQIEGGVFTVVMMKFQLEIKTIHKECALLTKIPLSLSVMCIFHWKKCLKIPKGVLFRNRYSVLMYEYLHSQLNVRLWTSFGCEGTANLSLERKLDICEKRFPTERYIITMELCTAVFVTVPVYSFRFAVLMVFREPFSDTYLKD